MKKDQNRENHRKLKLLKKQAARHLTAKSQFDFVRVPPAAKIVNRKTMKVKNNFQGTKIQNI